MDILKTSITVILVSAIMISCSNADNSVKVEKVDLKYKDKTLHFYKHTWGFSGNHSNIYISFSEVDFDSYNELNTIVLKGSEVVFFKLETDTLFVKSESEAEVPNLIYNEIPVVLDKTSNRDLILLNENISKNGYQKLGW